jgi:hypothetical protein
MKSKIAVYVTRDVAARLAMAAKRPGTSKSKIVNDALDQFLNPARDQHLATTIVQGQRDFAQAIQHLHRDLDIVAETLALWLRYFLTVTPPLPAGDQEPARLIGRQRFDVFIREVARRKPSDRRYLTRVVKLAAKEGFGPGPGAVSPRPPQEGKLDQATDGATGGKDEDDNTTNGG